MFVKQIIQTHQKGRRNIKVKKYIALFAAAAALSLQISATASAAAPVVPASLTISNGVRTQTVTLYGSGTANLENSITSEKLSDISGGCWDVCLTNEQMNDLISAAESGQDSWYSVDSGEYISGFTGSDGNFYSSDSQEFSDMMASISSGSYSGGSGSFSVESGL